MTSRRPTISISSLYLARKRSDEKPYPSCNIPVAVKRRLALGQDDGLYFRHFAPEDSVPFHAMRRIWTPGFNTMNLYQNGNTSSFPLSFVEKDDRPGQSVKLAFLGKDDETAIVGRLEHIVTRLGEAAIDTGDKRAIGGLIIALASNRGALGEEIANPLLGPDLIQHAFPEAWE